MSKSGWSRNDPQSLPLRVSGNYVKCFTCGKVAYPSKAIAKRCARLLYQGQHMRAYKCGQWWHLTSQDTDTTTQYREHADGDLRS